MTHSTTGAPEGAPPPDPQIAALLDAILPHVAFDGWSETAFRAAVQEQGMTLAQAHALCPRGAIDLAVALHDAGDRAMVEAVRAAELGEMRYRDRVAFALRARIEAVRDKEALRRATTLFALPHHAAEGSRLLWRTADSVWTALGDASDDVNWYTKRATLSGVWASVVLYWLGDDSLDHQATWSFIDRRIDDVMRIERAKASANKSVLLKPVTGALSFLFSGVHAPNRKPPMDLPGHWSPRR
ncbi:COQ9 family protein [Limimaricola cinnabarinus]|jgi:ubiquinone biosynthesis protein COQ9|uniref:Ubiquinone biosynthesis protein n=1 Tax=Limimaricola cinnabarinus TaxID=1125964 RepID=A0A2G1MGH4_9RHOB|nr:COQ9 family protein [Limimaricola cinnabarinus]PHP27853.1 ubiquinone biosynthesis protein [Limimaricola cinnabarinus]